MVKRYQVLVIGSGPAGHGAAIQAAKLGRTVAVVDKHHSIGGASVNTGTLPSKTLREAVLYLTGFRQRGIYGMDYRVKKDISVQDLMLHCDHVRENEKRVLASQFSRNRVDLIEGVASFINPHRVLINSDSEALEVEADLIIIATGSVPARSDTVPIDGSNIIDSDGVYNLPYIPDSMIIVGAGAIGVEYACIFAALGTEVTLVDMRREVLEFLDSEIREALFYHMRLQGIIFRLGEEVTRVARDNGTVTAYTRSNKRITGKVLLYTVGRIGTTRELALESVGIEPDPRGRIWVNENFQTVLPHVYAVGDVIGFPALAATSMEQGRIAVRRALGEEKEAAQEILPYGLYTIPEISMVGHTEKELTEKKVPYEIGLARYKETARGQIIGDTSGTLKLLFHTDTRKLLGVHVMGEGAAELVHIGQMVIGLSGDLDFLVNNTFNYPTLAECYRIATLDAYNKLV